MPLLVLCFLARGLNVLQSRFPAPAASVRLFALAKLLTLLHEQAHTRASPRNYTRRLGCCGCRHGPLRVATSSRQLPFPLLYTVSPPTPPPLKGQEQFTALYFNVIPFAEESHQAVRRLLTWKVSAALRICIPSGRFTTQGHGVILLLGFKTWFRHIVNQVLRARIQKLISIDSRQEMRQGRRKRKSA